MSADPQTHRLALVPRDGFFAKDGRGWSTSARTHVLDWPWPTTIRGALTTASGKAIEDAERRRFERNDWRAHHGAVKLKRMVALRRPHGGMWSSSSRMWPVPADALWLDDEEMVQRLDPTLRPAHTRTLGRAAPAAYADDPDWAAGYEAAREALWVPQNVDSNAKPLPPPRWWPEDILIKWLRGDAVATDRSVPPPRQWPSPQKRLQTHVSISGETLTGEDGLLYLHEIVETLETRQEWAIGVEAEWPTPAGANGAAEWPTPAGANGAAEVPPLVRLGSDSRIAWVETGTVGPSLFDLPQDVTTAFASAPRGLRLLITTPASFARGWVPDGFEPARDEQGKWAFRGRLMRPDGGPHAPIYDSELILRAACVPRPMHISGWDMASDKDKGGAPRATSRLVPPGAVYFFERAAERPGAEPQPFTADDAKALWLASLGGRTHEGFGRVVPGIWNPKDTASQNPEETH